tara:strand:- start:848 stop:1792 length:945 start_codon:yes stop_codon:yes gene_type:complete
MESLLKRVDKSSEMLYNITNITEGLNMYKILVTGGAGFIGSNLAKALSDQGNYVVSLDNYLSGSKANHHDDVHYIKGSTSDLWSIFGYQPNQFDYIFHLGEYARVEQSFGDYDIVMDYNYHSFPVVLDFAKHSNAKLIYSGSSTKFSVGEEGKMMSPYAYTKAQNTELLKAYAEWNDLEYTIVYFYNVYGDNEINDGDFATVIGKFLKMVKGGATRLPITSPGTQKRNFTHINDIVSGLIMAGFRGEGDGWGIGCDTQYEIKDLPKLMGVGALMTPEKPGNRMAGELKTSKLKALGWECTHSLEDYIMEKLNEK